MKRGLTILFCMCRLFASAEGEEDYAVANIPAALLKNANAIKRTEEILFEITEGNRARYRRKVAFTILNEQGDKWSMFGEGYDKLRSIEYFEGSLFDAEGKKIKSLKKGEIKDVSGYSDGSLADDNRIKWHQFLYKVYPYTVEYEIEVRYRGTMFIPDWIPLEKSLLSVQYSR
ncbi:MAG: DUF3857 domain-containing protein, partial [Chitinophagaceae bacterium]